MNVSKILVLAIFRLCSCKFDRLGHFNRHHRMTATARGRPFVELVGSTINMAARRDYYAERLDQLMENGEIGKGRQMLIQKILATTDESVKNLLAYF